MSEISSNFSSSVPRWFYSLIPYNIGAGMLENLLPLFIVQVIAGSVTDVGTVRAVISVASVLAFILWGNLSDRLKSRRPFLLLGFAGFGVYMLLLSFGTNVNQVLVYSLLGGFLISAVAPVATALVVDTVPEKQLPKAFRTFCEMGSWSFLGAIILGGIWLSILSNTWGTVMAMRSLFFCTGLLALSGLILCLLWVREPRQVTSRREFNPRLLGRLSIAAIERRLMFAPTRTIYFILRPQWLGKQLQRPLILYYLCSAIFFIGIHLFFTPFPIFLTEGMGATNTQVLLISLGKSGIEALFYKPMGQFLQAQNCIKLQAMSVAVRMGSLICFTLLALVKPTPVTLFLAGLTHLLTGITWAVINVSSAMCVAQLATKGQEGMALGMYNSVIGVATIFGALASGYIVASFGYSACFSIGAILCGFTAFGLWWLETVMPTGKARDQPF